MKRTEYILWLPSWYPNKLTPLNGDFIQRHAQAVSLYKKIDLIYIIRDEFGKITKDLLIEERENTNLKETIVYYYIPPNSFKLFEKIKSYLKRRSLYQRLINGHIQENGLPELAHVYVAINAGAIIKWLKKKFKIPYVITEQWTCYLAEARPNFLDFKFWSKRLCKKVFEGAAGTSVVSKYLGQRLMELFQIKSYEVIPNVVDANIFKPSFKKADVIINFLHISVLNYQKNPEDLIQAFSIIKRKGYAFRLDIVGPEQKELSSLVNELQLNENILFHPEMEHQELVKLMQQADALVLYSRYETFGCVLIEANACGIPVIVSDIPVFHENIVEGLNGTFAENENPLALAEKLIWFIENKNIFSPQHITENNNNKFNYKVVGKKFVDWYSQILKECHH
jgi:glycosyltransferase involved in cell wall biosynthesis